MISFLKNKCKILYVFILGTILCMVNSLLHDYLRFTAHIGTGSQIQAVPIAQVNATVPTSAAPSAGKFNNIDSQIGTQVADGSSKQILSQTVVQKTIPSVPATMMYPGIAMTMPGRTMTKPGIMNGKFLALFVFFL